MRRALRGIEGRNWVTTNLDGELIIVTLERQLPHRKWLAADNCGRGLVIADELLEEEWIGVLPD